MNDDVKINVVTLENDREYYEIKKMPLNGNEYLILIGVEDNDLAIRKLIAKENGVFITKLDSDDELQYVLKAFENSIKN